MTKLFVVLLVVLSLLQSAGIVVFVNKVENFKAQSDQLEARAKSAEAELTGRVTAAEAESARANAAATLLQQAVDDARKSDATLQQSIAKANLDLAKREAEILSLQTSVGKLGEGFKASEDAKAQLTTALGTIRTDKDSLQTQNAQLNGSITDLTNKLEVTERERRFLAEQATQSKSDNAKLSSAVKDMGGDVRTILASTSDVGIRGGAPKVNGVIRATRVIAQKPYATISIGSADDVRPGMEFKVINRDRGEFLGLLVIESVDTNESTGRLTGPRLEEIRPGVEVRTQF